MGVVFVLCGGCVCYCVGVVFFIVWGFCLLLCAGCVCYCVGVVFVIVWGFCLLLCAGCVCHCGGLCLLLCGDFVCYCVQVVFVIVGGCVCYCVGLFLSLSFLFGCTNLIMHFSINLLRFKVGASSGVICTNLRLVHYIRDCLICQCLTSFAPQFGMSALCLKCTEHVYCNSCVVQ